MLNADTPLNEIPKISPKYANLLEKLGLSTVQDFLFYFPFRYDDYSKIVPLSSDHLGETVTVTAKVVKSKLNRIFKKRLTIAEVILEDENQTPLKAVWFNQPFIIDSMPPETVLRLSGKLDQSGKYFTLASPAWEKASRDETNTGRLVPVYSETAGLTSKWIRWQISMLMEKAIAIPDLIPDELRKKFNLYALPKALQQMHFPDSAEKLAIAKKTFAFREMFLMQLQSFKVKQIWESHLAIPLPFNEMLIKDFTSQLPFQLTDAQRKAAYEILRDLEKKQPMNRLLNGDVGSGKTIVAAIAILQAVSRGCQVALLVPTEVLAKQHYEGLSKIFNNHGFEIALLTGAYKETNSDEPADQKIKSDRATLLEKIQNGKVRLIIGTHAIIQKDVRFKKLALVIIDEQHRFGVAQRAVLQQETMELGDGRKKTIPHLLTMTATPIPRTLAIAFFGSLNLSILDEMPKNRKPIITRIVRPKGRNQIYEFVRKEIVAGRQAFVILPLVEESKVLSEVRAAVEEQKKLALIFPEYNIGLLHGKMLAKNKKNPKGEATKEQVMQDFKAGAYQILVSTSVIEVGIDIPNATVIIIENAERFGLSQLHQFRGRVGRGQHQSYCFLFTDKSNTGSLARLKVLEESNDGFVISQKDLALRGPGQLLGRSQSGISDMAMESLYNLKLISLARQEAKSILLADPKLEKYPQIKKALEKFEQQVHLE